MNTISILKIESDAGIVLLSKNSTQEIMPIAENFIIRDVNSDAITTASKKRCKLKCIIKSKDTPDFSILNVNQKFTIYSIIDFLEYGKSTPTIPFIADSLQVYEKFTKFRPVFSMYLTGFKCEGGNIGSNFWTLEFEDT